MWSLSLSIFVLLPWMRTSYAFVVVSPTTMASSSSSSLWISSGDYRYSNTVNLENPEEQIQAYLDEPGPVPSRSDLDGTVLVSGLVNAEDRTDQFLFDLLNSKELTTQFDFTKIIAFTNNMSFSKKRLLSRSARYTGLLDKLEFMQAQEPQGLPTPEQLEGCKSWVACFDKKVDDDLLAQVSKVADVVKAVSEGESPTLKNVAILLAGANQLDASACQKAVDAMAANTNVIYTIIATGALQETPEGKAFYRFSDFGTDEGVLEEKALFSRQEAYRMVTEMLQLESGANRALSVREFTNATELEGKLIKGLREAGYARSQEIDHMLRDGAKKYKERIAEWYEKYPDYQKGYTTDIWWEQEEFVEKSRQLEERLKRKAKTKDDERQEEIEKIASDWVRQEYFRQSMDGKLSKDMTEAEFKESVWERAMFEADLKYRQLRGEKVKDGEAAMDEFRALQEKKKQALLDKARAELTELLESENLGGDDLRERLYPDDDKKDDKTTNDDSKETK